VGKFAGGSSWRPGGRERTSGFELTAIGPSRRLIGSGLFALLAISMLPTRALAQTPQPMPPGPPPNPARPPLAPVDQADADYRFLRDPTNRTDFWDTVKYVPLDRTGNAYVTFGFEARAEYEYFHNQMWGGGPQDTDGYFLGRLIPAVGLTLQPHVRFFAASSTRRNPATPPDRGRVSTRTRETSTRPSSI
jgi:hypothetical protein